MALPHSQYTTSRGLVYSYVHIAPQVSGLSYLLFLHGFPSTSYHWRHQIEFFTAKGYGILAPDLLGFGATSKPESLNMYKAKDMAMDIVEIMEVEKVERVIGIGHDWGSYMLSRLANYHPDRFSAYVFIDHGYGPPGQDLSPQAIERINASVQNRDGFSILGYFLFFNEDDAPETLNKHSESVETLYFTSDDNLNKQYKGAPGGLRLWLTGSKSTELPQYLTPEDHSYYQKTFSAENGGYGSCINWYRAALQNINGDDEKDIELPNSSSKLRDPTLLIASTGYFISVAMNYPKQMTPFVPELQVQRIEGGHWLQLEKPGEVNQCLDQFIEESK